MTKHHGSGALDRRGFMARVALGGAALTAGLPARALLAAGKAPEKVNVAFFDGHVKSLPPTFMNAAQNSPQDLISNHP